MNGQNRSDVKIGAKVSIVLKADHPNVDHDFHNTIANGIRKVNICTEMCLAAHRASQETAGFESSILAATEAVKQIVASKMQLFGSAGKA